MKVAIVGGREFNNYSYLCETMGYYNTNNVITEVVCGLARGADTLGSKWAKENGITVTEFKPDWKNHGKAAGPMRNIEMADYADAVVAFWDGKSRGTKQMIEYSKKIGLKVRVRRYDEPQLKKPWQK